MAESVCALQTAEVISWGPIGAELGLGQIGLGLMQPIGRAVHSPMMPFATGFTKGFGREWGQGGIQGDQDQLLELGLGSE